MSRDANDDVMEVLSPSEGAMTSQEDSTTPPSTPETNTSPRRSKRLNSPDIETPRRSKRIRNQAADSVTCSGVSAVENDDVNNEFKG
jgi:hypothetical protein